MHVLYALRCPFEGVVRYIGKTGDPEKRLRQHIKRAKAGETQHHCANWIRHLLAAGKRPELVVLCRLPENANWQVVERLLIGFSRMCGFPVTNTTSGGEGVSSIDGQTMARRVANWKQTMAEPARRERWQASLSAAHADPEVKAKRRDSARAAWSDPEVIARHAAAVTDQTELERKSKAMKEVWQRPDYFERMKEIAAQRMQELGALDRLIAACRAADAIPENRAKRIAAVKKAASAPEYRARQASAATETGARPEVKAARSAALKASWADPEQRAAREAALALAKPAMSAAKKASWSDPETAARIKAAQKAAWADPVKKAERLAKREAMWADPVQRAALIEKQKAAWIKRRERQQPKD